MTIFREKITQYSSQVLSYIQTRGGFPIVKIHHNPGIVYTIDGCGVCLHTTNIFHLWRCIGLPTSTFDIYTVGFLPRPRRTQSWLRSRHRLPSPAIFDSGAAAELPSILLLFVYRQRGDSVYTASFVLHRPHEMGSDRGGQWPTSTPPLRLFVRQCSVSINVLQTRTEYTSVCCCNAVRLIRFETASRCPFFFYHWSHELNWRENNLSCFQPSLDDPTMFSRTFILSITITGLPSWQLPIMHSKFDLFPPDRSNNSSTVRIEYIAISSSNRLVSVLWSIA